MASVATDCKILLKTLSKVIGFSYIENLIQVSLDITDEVTRERESRALIKASEALKCDDLVVINRDIESTEPCTWQGVTRTVRFIPLWKWLLNNESK